MRNAVQLITYADRLGGSLDGLRQLLDGPLEGLFGGVHVLPFFTPYDGADAGFDPADHTEVDPRLGTWDDVRALAQSREVIVDVICNHISAESAQFRDFLAHAEASAFAEMFLTLRSVFPSGATEQDLLAIYRPRPGLPLTPYSLRDGTRRLMWTTFTGEQIDLDVRSAPGRAYLHSVLDRLAAAEVAMIRLDAVGYAVKVPGTSSFMVPQTFEFISGLTEDARRRGLEVLVEVHSHFELQIAIGRQVDRVYDFALPPLVLHTLMAGDATALQRWLTIRPRNAVTVLDTHDGIGVIDVGADSLDPSVAGLLGRDEIADLVEGIHVNSGGTSRQATGAAAANLDLYQVNCTLYDALARNDDHYLLARLLQFFTPGIPQVYYVGLLAGTNDMELLARTRNGRDVNRHHYDPGEIVEALDTPVVRTLTRLIRWRNEHPAFAGTFSSALEDGRLTLSWRAGEEQAVLTVDVAARSYTVTCTHEGRLVEVADVAALPG